jgi:hypothetical protein
VPESEEAKREKREGGDERWKERRGDLTGLDFSSASTEFGIEFGEMRFNKEGANFRKKHGLNGCNILFSLRCLKKKKNSETAARKDTRIRKQRTQRKIAAAKYYYYY